MTIEVTYGTVTTAASDIRKAAGEIGTQLSSLQGRVAKVVAGWDGEAREAFHLKQRGWDQEVQGLKDTLDAIATALDNSTAGYQGTDKKTATLFDF
ncbi:MULTISPECIES: WXG100 family type VII secretion target [unclassified Streptomyces]|uniref:WXG100 family type VII secretion target n=1 Tax=unclassified Streptomyces TaxID=2593676 RepID=UPI0022B71879|nr:MULTISPECIES: WXG100 family type VII secretion target [unclassified Streptomyces]MCZ7416190.1 WXG100 family type VII secretion target [Streptomyces sp. WMMC897]MCZ7434001.1 WXG100 family type VII secretion target [Streptomyces sp. WMMC1477]